MTPELKRDHRAKRMNQPHLGENVRAFTPNTITAALPKVNRSILSTTVKRGTDSMLHKAIVHDSPAPSQHRTTEIFNMAHHVTTFASEF